MANGYDCDKHSKVEERLYKLESEDKIMNEKINSIEKILNELKTEMSKLKETVNSMNAKLIVGGTVLYTILNILLKKIGL